MFKACGWNQSHVNHARVCIYIDASRMRLVAMLGLSNGDPFMLTIYPHVLARTHLGQEPLKEITCFVDQEIQNWSAVEVLVHLDLSIRIAHPDKVCIHDFLWLAHFLSLLELMPKSNT
jgi:hypothetical protein